MLYSKQRFFDQIWSLRFQYRTQNAWVQNWRQWDDDYTYMRYLNFAYNLYANTAKSLLHFTLLGDTEIRSMEALVMNFGLMSANGVQDEKDEKMVKGIQDRRNLNAQGAKVKASKVLGPGSILGDKQWTPILNDCLMLGSIEARQEFHLVLNTKEQALWDKLGFNNNKVSQLAQKFGGQVDKPDKNAKSPVNKWNYFLRVSPATLWNPDNNVPRVFIRELLSLKLSGYKPHFFNSQLSFSPGSGAVPSFTEYLHFLDKVHFPAADKVSLYSEIGEFLFNDSSFRAIP